MPGSGRDQETEGRTLCCSALRIQLGCGGGNQCVGCLGDCPEMYLIFDLVGLYLGKKWNRAKESSCPESSSRGVEKMAERKEESVS